VLLSAVQKLILLSISRSNHLLELAEASEWDTFMELDAQRQAALEEMQLQALELTEQQHAQVQSQMQVLIKLNDQLERVCRQQRSDLAGEMTTLRQGKKAKKAYSQ